MKQNDTLHLAQEFLRFMGSGAEPAEQSREHRIHARSLAARGAIFLNAVCWSPTLDVWIATETSPADAYSPRSRTVPYRFRAVRVVGISVALSSAWEGTFSLSFFESVLQDDIQFRMQ